MALKGRRFGTRESILADSKKAYPNHHWYKPMKELEELQKMNRNQQTALARLRSGQIKTLKFKNEQKTFNNCLKCISSEIYPEHILSCSELTIEDLFSRPITTVAKLERSGLQELV
ncbi:hypothetical protein LAZ67_17001901 [Cordylochernes scorpioides]|uniref:Uncharacterized protein n=1 Tax=Cordylochernes scorpioides TaxID=51811 RepID=A0ABY6LDS6_9ARAC|nr:hypothetical protein LAZ67_17001901 [Cordylochernes scorpioides]